MQRVAAFQQQGPVVELAVLVQQHALQRAELTGQQTAQLQIAVDHVVDHAQHQVGRARRQPGAAARSGLVAPFGQSVELVREELAHLAIRRMHRHQHPVEHREADRAGVDGTQRALGRGQRAVFVVNEQVLAAGRCRQAPEHQHVVPGRVVEVRRQLVIDQVGHMQVDNVAAAPTHQCLLHAGLAHLELTPPVAHPQEASLGQRVGQGGQLLKAIGLDVKNPHADLSPVSTTARRPARSRSAHRRRRRA
mmetsp:Transcript_9901/g.23198  ORF Transcript_9901/g.23198 Transcript_9901/m.23198 type:complete len:249 (+) Transcript_9901:846-1592(+)